MELNRTLIAILRVLDRYSGVVGSREISKQLRLYGVDLTERTVRYHLRILDERGLTEVIGKEGHRITGKGRQELGNGLVSERVGFVSSRIEALSYLTTLDLGSLQGQVILNISFFDGDDLGAALAVLPLVYASPYVMSDRLIVRRAGDRIGSVTVPEGKVGIGTVCSVTINGICLKAGIPVTSRFGGVVEVRDGRPLRFTSLISYEGSSLDPLEVFIRSKMTDVLGAVKGLRGSILASFREIPVVCLDEVKKLSQRMKESGIGGVLLVGDPNKALLEVPVSIDKVGVVVVGGLNPIAALEESGIATDSKAMSTLYEYSHLKRIHEL